MNKAECGSMLSMLCGGPSRSQPQYFPGAGGLGGGVDWSTFPGKFHQSAKKIVAKMHSNAYLIADNMKRTVEEVLGRNR